MILLSSGPSRCLATALAAGFAAGMATPMGGEQGDGTPPSYFETLSLDAQRRLTDLEGREEELPVHGIFSTRWRSRWNDGDVRSDISAYLGLDIGAQGSTPFSFHMRAGSAWDLNHTSDPTRFDGILQSYDSGVWTRLYDLYIDVHEVPELSVLRVGRQSDVETPEPVVYDGLRVETDEHGELAWSFGAYGGRAVRYYDSFDDGHALYGANLTLKPWNDGLARLDWLHADDETTLGGVRDDLIGLELRHRLDEFLRLGGYYSVLDGRSRDLRLDTDWTLPELDAQIRARYYELLQPQEFRATEFDPFSDALGVWDPFRRINLDASKRFQADWSLRGGLDLRRMSSSDDVGEFNRDYDRFFLGATLEETAEQPYTAGLTADYWQGSGRDVWTWGVDAGRRLASDMRGVLGTYYSLWKTDYELGEEREDVRTYFARLEYDVSDDLRMEGRYEFEDSSLLDFHILRLKATWSF
jgi:hypothetical protein